MQRFLLSLLILAGCFQGKAQSTSREIDSLKNILKQTEVDSVRFRIHFLIAQKFLTAGIYDSQLVHASHTLELAEKISPLNEQQKKFYAGSLRLKGIYYRTQGDFERAISFYLQALNEFEVLKDSNGQASTINSIGIAYLALKRFDESYEYFSRAYELDHLLKKPAKEVADLTNMCYALHGSGNRPDSFYNKALKLGIQAMEIARSLGEKQLMMSCAESVGLSLFHLKHYNESMVYQRQALSIAEELQLKPSIAEQEYLMAQLYNSMGDYSKAIEYGLKSERLAQSESFYVFYQDIYGALTEAYEKTGNYKKAFEYSSKLNQVLDSTYQTQIADQLKRFESERKDNEIKLLSSENELKEKENQLLKAANEVTTAKLQRNRAWVIGLVVALALFGILLYVLYNNRQQKIWNIKMLKQLNDELREQKEEISRMNTVLELKALRAQMNPHFIFNCMSSIQECMLTGRLDDANTYLSKLSKLLRMVLLYADDESVSLDKELGMLKLYLDLESLRLRDGFHYEIKVDDEIFPEEIQVPTLILQPFAENAIWHGLLNKPNDRQLKIKIATSGNTLDCVVEDNGIGREKAHEIESGSKKHQSKGLELIERRLSIIRKKSKEVKIGVTFTDLKNSLQESAGTRVSITLPFLSS